ncbi:Hypothetical predicted protein [Olea europaea subsp. europaea]|uniref:Uncharacterized protein n=1 Tax=Olea europaea subsp. europaea TaxID=158383 RepID=A0A8S0SPF9_OLEEU|nr:Hypothetical predicted protein [Olea europaea subsp. europaea]
MASASLSACSILWLLFVSHSFLPSVSFTDELSLVLQFFSVCLIAAIPSLVVEKSPESNAGTNVKCERVHIYGFRRLKHLSMFAISVKVKVSYVNPSGRLPNVEICFHRWELLLQKVSRCPLMKVFLVLGIMMITLASWLSKSLVFYCSGATSVGVLVILVILFQGMKLLPTGQKSSLAIFLYSCSLSTVSLGVFLLDYVPRLLRSVLLEIGISQDITGNISVWFLAIAGAWLGYWSLQTLLILQVEFFCFCSVEELSKPKVIQWVYKKLCRLEINLGKSLDPYASNIDESYVVRFGSFFCSFHNTPERRKFSKDEWEKFTWDTPRKALKGLVSSPDFNKWAVANADRITLAPKKEARDRQKRWFHWL